MSAILSIQNLTKSYRVYSKPAHRLIEILSFNRCLRHKPVHALNNISLELEQGDRLGIMGENGSGKSTLLKILTGVLSPSSGQVVVRGKVAALLELGTGFNSDLTGHENVFQNGYLMGFSKQEMEERFPQILQFSELGDAINYPLKSYSSGMLMRLGFSCAVFVNPDILIVDEALSVGDGYFQTKCFYMIKSLIDKGTTFLYVSHGQDSVRTLCNKAIVLEKGRIIQSGDGHAVSDFYASYIYRKQMESNWIPTELVKEAGETKNLKAEEKGLDATDFSVSEDFARRVADLRQGSGLVRITDVIMLVNGDQPTSSVQVHDTLTLRVCFEAFAQLGPTLSLGIGICDENGLEILQCATLDEGVNLESAFEYSRHVVSFTFRNVLAPGRYSIVAGLADLTSDSTYLQHNIILAVHDVCYGALVFEVFKSQRKAIWGKVVHDFIVSATRL